MKKKKPKPRPRPKPYLWLLLPMLFLVAACTVFSAGERAQLRESLQDSRKAAWASYDAKEITRTELDDKLAKIADAESALERESHAVSLEGLLATQGAWGLSILALIRMWRGKSTQRSGLPASKVT